MIIKIIMTYYIRLPLYLALKYIKPFCLLFHLFNKLDQALSFIFGKRGRYCELSYF